MNDRHTGVPLVDGRESMDWIFCPGHSVLNTPKLLCCTLFRTGKGQYTTLNLNFMYHNNNTIRIRTEVQYLESQRCVGHNTRVNTGQLQDWGCPILTQISLPEISPLINFIPGDPPEIKSCSSLYSFWVYVSFRYTSVSPFHR